MKVKRNIGGIFLLLSTLAFGQSSFTIEQLNDPYIDFISDVSCFREEYFCLVIHLQPNGSQLTTYSSVDIYSNTGDLSSSVPIDIERFRAYQILNLTDSSITILGNHLADTCTSSLKILEVQTKSDSIHLVTEFSLCEGRYLQKAILINGIENDKFIQCQYGSGSWFYKALLQWKNEEGISMVFDSLSVYENFGIDYSRKGYILKGLDVCNFYTRNFQYRKQRYNFMDGYQPSASSTLMPYNEHYILEHVKKPFDHPYQGQVVRVIDSLLNIKEINSISMPAPNNPEIGFMDLPFFGGLKKTSDNHYWMAGTFAFSTQWDSNYFCVSKFDSELNLVCNQFFGFDAVYRLFGTTVTPDGGCLAYGWKLPKGGVINSGDENYFAIKLGPNCELPTTPTFDPESILTAITVYPNPATNSISINVQGFDPATLQVEIVNVQGITLFSRQDLSYDIEVSDLPAGQYFYRIVQDGKILGVGGWMKE